MFLMNLDTGKTWQLQSSTDAPVAIGSDALGERFNLREMVSNAAKRNRMARHASNVLRETLLRVKSDAAVEC